MIQPERIKTLNTKPVGDGKYVLYWMQAAQRTEYNHALEYAIGFANKLQKPVVVFLGIKVCLPQAKKRHY